MTGKTGEHKPAARWGRRRILVLLGAFLIIAVNPFLNFYLQIDFLQGWYQSLGVGDLWFVSPLEGLASLLITRSLYMPALVGMVIPVILAYLLGRVFCSWLCPVSFFLELVDRLRRIVSGKRHIRNRLVVAKRVLWFTLIGELLISMIVGAPLFVFLSPPGLVGREIMMAVFFHKLALEGVLLLIIVALELVTRRFFCRSFCPLGALLALIGSRRRLLVTHDPAACTRCGRCRRSCPMGLVPEEGEGRSPYCWNCAQCLDSCRDDALAFSWRSGEKR